MNYSNIHESLDTDCDMSEDATFHQQIPLMEVKLKAKTNNRINMEHALKNIRQIDPCQDSKIQKTSTATQTDDNFMMNFNSPKNPTQILSPYEKWARKISNNSEDILQFKNHSQKQLGSTFRRKS